MKIATEHGAITGPRSEAESTTTSHGRSALRDVGFFAASVLLLMLGVWSITSISGQDEYYLSFRTVLEMQERGEWLTPWVNGEVRLKKPPLLYWMMLALFETLGPSPLAARLPAVLMGAGFALATNRLAGLFGARGYLAGLLALGCAGVAVESRRAMFDLPVACWVTVALCCAVQWWRRGRLLAMVATATSLGAATMTKGPVALWFFVAPLLAGVATLSGHRWRQHPWWHVAVGLLLFCAVALPWPLWIAWRWPEFWSTMAEQAERREFGLPGPGRVFGLLGAGLGLVVPWSIAVLGAGLGALRGRGPSVAPRRWLLVWCILGAVPFAFMKTFERYMVALVCPMTILASIWLPSLTAEARRTHWVVAVTLVSIPTVVFSAFVLWFGLGLWLPLVALAACVAAWRSALRRDAPATRPAALVAVSLALLLGAVYPSIGINALPDDLPGDLVDRPVATFGRSQPGMLSIVRKRSIQEIPSDPLGLPERLADWHGYLFVLDQDCGVVDAAAERAGLDVERGGSFRSFYSRKTWLKFFRQGLSGDDWMRAIAERDVSALQPLFVWYRFP